MVGRDWLRLPLLWMVGRFGRQKGTGAKSGLQSPFCLTGDEIACPTQIGAWAEAQVAG